MKTLILALTLMLGATSAFAAEGKVIATVSNVNAQIAAVTLTQDGVVNVVLRERHAPLTERLSQATAQRLAFVASYLANAQLTTEHHLVVCMMVINPFFMTSLSIAPYDEQAGEWKDGAAREVLSPQSCALSTSTFPADRQAYADAVSLKGELVDFANELVGANN